MQKAIPTIQELLASGIKEQNNRKLLLKRLNYKYKAFCKNSKCKSVVDKLDLEIKFQKYILNTYGIKFNIFSENEVKDIYAKRIVDYTARQSISTMIANLLQIDVRRLPFASTLHDSESRHI